jgi:hypothetical protein
MNWYPAGARSREHWSARMNAKRTNVGFEGQLADNIFDRHFGIRHFEPWRYDNDTDPKRW